MKKIKQKDLVRILKDNHKNESDTRFVFLLGAGASVQSDIPSANSLAKVWLSDIKEDLEKEEFEEWQKNNEINEKYPSSKYTEIFRKRFEHNPKNGYETLQKLMEDKQPSIGYTILSQILDNTKHNFVVTTNFDALIEDALFLFTSKRPLVCGHESLANFIQLNSTRPTIIKVHRDILLDPYNTPENTCSLENSLENALKPILANSPLIVIGYGGNDESIMSFLKNSSRQDIYWCVRDLENIPEQISTALKENDKLVKIDGFDELMVALHSNVYEFESIESLSSDKDEDSLIVKNAYEKVALYKKELEKFRQEVEGSNSQEFKENSKSILPSWWDYQLKVNETEDIDLKEKIYEEGIKVHKESFGLAGNYANFLKNIREDYDNAEIYYKKALEIEPNHATICGNYANFLKNIREDYDNAEIYYKKALEIEPNHANFCGNYANFLKNIKKDYDNAEIYYKKSLEIEPNNANNCGNYASLLFSKNKNDKAKEYLNKAFEFCTNEKDLLIELWFYKMTHIIKEYEEAKNELDELLNKGYNSKNWDFSKNIKRAKENGHPHIEVLKEYAHKISGLDYSHR